MKIGNILFKSILADCYGVDTYKCRMIFGLYNYCYDFMRQLKLLKSVMSYVMCLKNSSLEKLTCVPQRQINNILNPCLFDSSSCDL